MVTIKLNSYGKNEFTGVEILHQKEMEIVEKLLKNAIQNVSGENDDKELEPPIYNSILVSGKRGAGKTSFLYSLKAKIESKEEKDTYQSVCMLDFLDPTLIEEKAPIFLTIISLIKSNVDKKFESKCDDNAYLCCKKEWKNALEELAKGLPLTNETSKVGPDYWDDASQILSKGLKDMHAAFNLRKNFNAVLAKSLRILDKKLFVLLIDDVDTDFSKSFPLLETLRKYLCTPYIATVVSGDFTLFSAAVRRRQWENFGKSLLINEYDKEDSNTESDKPCKNHEKYQSSVTELEAQYLQKLFKPENRIQLRTLKEINEEEKEAKNEEDSITIQLGEDEKTNFSKKFNEFYKDVFEKFGIKNTYQRAAYLDFITGVPVRTQINFMQCFQNENDITPDLYRKIISLFSAELAQHDIDLYKIQEDRFLCVSILKYLVSEHLLDEYYQMEPISADATTDSCIFVLSLLFSAKVKKNPCLFFDYMLRIAYMRNLLEEIGYRSEENKECTIEGLIKHCGAYSDSDFRQMACYMTAYIQSSRKTAGNGILKLPSLYRKSKKNKESAFDSVVDNSTLKEWQKKLVYLPLSVNLLDSNNTVNTYSMFTLLGSIADIIREKETENSTKEILTRLSQLRSYPTPRSSVNGTGSQPDNSDDEGNIDIKELSSDENKNRELFDNVLDTWLNFIKKLDFSVSSYMVAKIMTRCFYSFATIISDKKDKSLATVMELLVYQLIHSVLIEEYTECKASSAIFSINTNNLANSVKLLRSNLMHVKNDEGFKEKSVFPVTKMFLSCPFLLVYTHRSGEDGESVELYKLLKDIIEDDLGLSYSNFLTNEVYEVLDKIILTEANKDVEGDKDDTSKRSKRTAKGN